VDQTALIDGDQQIAAVMACYAALVPLVATWARSKVIPGRLVETPPPETP
jgi:hypothetical protein